MSDVESQRLWNVCETPTGKARAGIEVDVLKEGEIRLVVAADLREQLAPEQACGARDAEHLGAAREASPVLLSPAPLEGGAASRQALASAVDLRRRARRPVPQDARLRSTQLRLV